MSVHSSRWILIILFALFIIQTVLVYTTGTEDDKGMPFLNEEAKKGKIIFQEYNCTACHQLYGLGGYMGPDLTNTISAKGKGLLYAKALLQTGTQRMPNFHLSSQEIDALIAYLTYVDKTGISPVKKFKFNYDGTISQESNK